MNSLYNVCEFMKSVEEEHPIPAHADLFLGWAEDVRNLWKSQDMTPDIELENAFEDLLEIRRKVHEHEVKRKYKEEKREVEEKGWEWLLSVKQVEQRTDEWIAEGREILTASEIGALWKGEGTRAALVKKKAAPPTHYVAQQAVRRDATGPMDWGVRYEPIVKTVLEKDLGVKIVDLGRIRHRTIDRLGASPDGLIVSGPEIYVGKLVEIKCPPTRTINENIPFEYWCQMQLQMEICDRPACEYVEVKFKEVEAHKIRDSDETPDEKKGYITLEANIETLLHRYRYHSRNEKIEQDPNWIQVETYGWEIEKIRRSIVLRDKEWFQKIQKDLEAFWKDVEACREGTWKAPESKRKKKQQSVEKCFIQDDEVKESDTQIKIAISLDTV
jgi:hypothetical protein